MKECRKWKAVDMEEAEDARKQEGTLCPYPQATYNAQMKPLIIRQLEQNAHTISLALTAAP